MKKVTFSASVRVKQQSYLSLAVVNEILLLHHHKTNNSGAAYYNRKRLVFYCKCNHLDNVISHKKISISDPFKFNTINYVFLKKRLWFRLH